VKLTLYKYILQEIWPTFLATLFVSVFIIVATRMLSITELVVARGVGASQVLLMVGYLLPDIMVFGLPAASLIAVVVAFLRLSADSEIIAMKSSGISIYQMLPPVVVLSLVGFLVALSISIWAVPWGNRSFKDLLFQIAQSKADLGIKESVFCEPFPEVVFFVNGFSSRDKVMKDVFVVDRRDKSLTNTIVAEEAKIFLHPRNRMITLRFLNGTILMVEKDLRSSRNIKFNTYDLNIGLKDIMAALAKRQRAPKELTVSELALQIKELPKGELRHNEMLIELLERFSIPLAVFFMGIIGVPLGAQMRARGRSTGIALGLGVFLIYYMCLAGAKSICETGSLSPAVGVWIPDLFLMFSGAVLLWLAAHEHTLSLDPFLRKWRALQRAFGR